MEETYETKCSIVKKLNIKTDEYTEFFTNNHNLFESLITCIKIDTGAPIFSLNHFSQIFEAPINLLQTYSFDKK